MKKGARTLSPSTFYIIYSVFAFAFDFFFLGFDFFFTLSLTFVSDFDEDFLPDFLL